MVRNKKNHFFENFFASQFQSFKRRKVGINHGYSIQQNGFTSVDNGTWVPIDQAIPSDLNGDGKCDLIIKNRDSVKYKYYSVLSNGSSFGTPSYINEVTTNVNFLDHSTDILQIMTETGLMIVG